jgi:arsenate reductase
MAKRILFICTGNSARSIMAEVIARDLGLGAWETYSAGAKPFLAVNPLAIKTLIAHSHKTDGLYSKSLKLFWGQDFDYVVTVCDNAREACPNWPGKAQVLHWSLPDPAAASGSETEKLAFFEKIYGELTARISDLLGIVSQTK